MNDSTAQLLFGRKFGLLAYGQPSLNQLGQPTGPGFNLTSGTATIVRTPTKGLDLSEMQVQFKITGADAETPKNLVARVLNLSETTARQIQQEFSRVIMQAGYEIGSQYGVVFDGTIKEVRKGRLDADTSYLDIYASDSDLAYNFALVNQTLSPDLSTPQGIATALSAAVAQYGARFDAAQLPESGGVLPRGKVLFGMYRDHMSQLAASTNNTWLIENGVVKVFSQAGYLPGEAVVINAKTGLIGVPEATQEGVNVQCLLNPKIRLGGLIQLNNADINTTIVREQGFPNYASLNFFASTATDGIYRVLVLEHSGDTRGEDWYTDLVCLAVDPSTAPAASVPAGAGLFSG